MKCPFCKTNKADKTNTHYLTDSIIRTCLNHKGVRRRDNGLFVTIDTSEAFIEPSFQREVSPEALKEVLGHETSDEENVRATKCKPFSVDYVFCKKCEQIFTKIEESFNRDVQYLRAHPFEQNKESSYVINDTITTRLFFYLQLWRTHICDPNFSLSDTTAELLRLFLIGNNIEINLITSLPLVVIYLETKLSSEEKESFRAQGLSEEEILTTEQILYTTNVVTCLPFSNPYVLLMNDFAVLLFENWEAVPKQWHSFVNYKEDSFSIYIVSNSDRKTFLGNLHRWLVTPELKRTYYNYYRHLCKKYGLHPTEAAFTDILSLIMNAHFSMEKYSKKTFETTFLEYFVLPNKRFD